MDLPHSLHVRGPRNTSCLPQAKLVKYKSEAAEGGDDLFRPDEAGTSGQTADPGVEQGTMDLLADVRNFVAFQAEADGEASTVELVSRFKRSLPSQQSPLFKAFLQQICDFSRNHEGKGIWRLKQEFR